MGGRRETRLGRRAVEQVFVSGWSFPSRHLVARGLWRADDEACRLAVLAGRKVGGAVQRNRARRRVREAFRRLEGRLPRGLDAVIVVRGSAGRADDEQLRADVERVLDGIEGLTPT